MYCINNKIKENELKEKIKNLEYEDLKTGKIVTYNKEKNEELPISLEKIHKFFINKNKKKPNKKKEIKIKNCNFCGMKFPEMSEEEKKKHLVLCFNNLYFK